MTIKLSRRTVLRGLGTCLSLPLLDVMRSPLYGAESQFKPLGSSTGPQPRMICCYVPNGVNILEWMPEGQGQQYQLSPTLQVLEPHRQDFTILSGLGHPASKGGHSGADTWLTGADLAAKPGSDYSNTVSADQIVAAHHGRSTRFASLQLSDQSGTGAAGHSHTLSFDRGGTPVPAENSPRQLFNRLFVPDSDTDRAATLKRYAEKKSILDSVIDEADRLNRRLGRNDQQKLGQYLQSVRETEQRVERLESWVDVPKPQIDAKLLQINSQPGDKHDRPMWIDVDDGVVLSSVSYRHDASHHLSVVTRSRRIRRWW